MWRYGVEGQGRLLLLVVAVAPLSVWPLAVTVTLESSTGFALRVSGVVVGRRSQRNR